MSGQHTEGFRLSDFRIERYPHGGARVWREEDSGLRDLALDIYEPEERRDEILGLIAAAPTMKAEIDSLKEQRDELLEVLRSLENDAGQMPDFMWDMVQAAIAKATAAKEAK